MTLRVWLSRREINWEKKGELPVILTYFFHNILISLPGYSNSIRKGTKNINRSKCKEKMFPSNSV